ncbi:MAG: hypothetical protein KF832_00060 [Caldilineaceae bacterium]|nr:hypothetical protein [Caldilineaceae bacterium]
MLDLGRLGGGELGGKRSSEGPRVPWLGFLVMLVLSLGCSAAGLAQRTVATPPPTRELAPTFTPTPETILPQIVVTPPQAGTPGVIVILPGMNPSDFLPTATPIPGSVPLPSDTPIPSIPSPQPGETLVLQPTPTPSFTETPTPPPTATATPFIVVESGLVSLRTGPGVEYPLVAQLGPRIPIAIIGQNPEGTWYQLCCVNGNTVWVTAAHVVVNNDPSGAQLLVPEPPPPPTPTPTFTETPTITPTPTATAFPFDQRGDPSFFPTNNEFITVWVKLYVGTPPNEDPADGYFLKMLFNDVERTGTNGIQISTNEFKAVGVPGTAYSNLRYNLKYEYMPPDPRSIGSSESRAQLIGTGTWKMWIVDGAGNQLSNVVQFTTQPTNIYREVFIAWERVR